MEINKTCANCNIELGIGADTIMAQHGVTGLKGFIPLENVLYFCCERCIGDYFDIGDLPSLPRRVP